jgi:hypothetical protein
MSREIELLTEIRDLLLVLAEPALAQRDQKLREALREVVGKGAKNRAAVFLMNGSMPQASIAKSAQIDQGQLSRLMKALASKSLIVLDDKNPKLAVTVPATFFDADGKPNE